MQQKMKYESLFFLIFPPFLKEESFKDFIHIALALISKYYSKIKAKKLYKFEVYCSYSFGNHVSFYFVVEGSHNTVGYFSTYQRSLPFVIIQRYMFRSDPTCFDPSSVR